MKKKLSNIFDCALKIALKIANIMLIAVMFYSVHKERYLEAIFCILVLWWMEYKPVEIHVHTKAKKEGE